MSDPHLRGRRMVSEEIAREIAESELPPWDHGLAWGGLTLSSSCANTHFCVVGAPGSGKTMLLRLLMQSALPQIGRAAKTKEYERTVDSPATAPAAAPPAPPEDPKPVPFDFSACAYGHPLPVGLLCALSAAISCYVWNAESLRGSLTVWAWGALTLALAAWTAYEYMMRYYIQEAYRRKQREAAENAPAPKPPPAPRTETVPGPAWGKHRALVYDAKRDIMSLLHGMDGVECPIYTLNPFDDRCAAWDMAKDVTSPATALQFATILIPDNPRASQPFFDLAARKLLTGILIALMKNAGREWEFRDVVLAAKSHKNLVALLQSVPETIDTVEQFLSDGGPADNGVRQSAAIMATLATKMAPFEFVAAAWSHAKHKVSLEEWLNSEYVLVLGNDSTHGAALKAINRLIFRQVSDRILRKDETSTDRTWVFIDEAREAGNLDGLSSLMTQGRSKGACIVLGFQDIEGLRDCYGATGANEIVGMCATRAFLRLESSETAKWASALFGEFEAIEDKRAWSQGSGETIGDATTNGSSTTKGTSASKGKSRSIAKGILTTATNSSTGESSSKSENSSYSTNASQSSNFNETVNRERVQRAALLTSQFMSLPATNPQNGLTGYFASPFTGAYQGHIAGSQLDGWLHPPEPGVPNVVHRDDSHQYIRPWDDEELKRLQIKQSPPPGAPTSGSGQAPTSGPAAAAPPPTGKGGLVDPFADS